MMDDHRSDCGLVDWRSPFKLYRDQEPVGPIVSYWSERPWAPDLVENGGHSGAENPDVQPWATGVFDDDDHDRAERTDRLLRFLPMMQERGRSVPADEQDSEEFTAEMARNGATQADLDWCTRGTWTIQTWDGKHHPMHSVCFIAPRTLRWQW
ncbi:hypothetical protein ACFYO1_31750 [Nocardia sp. NPDC006044]|uniref:hypothetical protein n=1 Tax=Nocardia sp. NPDC006044 TaxID=3364306 RepID=UPI0036B8EA9C